MLKQDLAKFSKNNFDYIFSNSDLLTLAFTHRSSSSEHNERLEFLGDAVLDLVISDRLFKAYPSVDEGDLSRMRSWLVKKEALYEIGEKYQFSKMIRMGDGEARSGGQQRKSTIADTVEALIAAVYLDGGFLAAEKLIDQMFAEKLASLPEISSLKDAKSRLQEFLQDKQEGLPEYSLVKEKGKPHEKIFTVSCRVEAEDILEYADGNSRRKAEQLAAQQVLNILLKQKKT